MDVYQDAYSTSTDAYNTEVDFNTDMIEVDDIQNWRNHDTLHIWMTALYISKGGKDESFNDSAVNINIDDLLDLLVTVGTYESDQINRDLLFIDRATSALEHGKKVFYVAAIE